MIICKKQNEVLNGSCTLILNKNRLKLRDCCKALCQYSKLKINLCVLCVRQPTQTSLLIQDNGKYLLMKKLLIIYLREFRTKMEYSVSVVLIPRDTVHQFAFFVLSCIFRKSAIYFVSASCNEILKLQVDISIFA